MKKHGFSQEELRKLLRIVMNDYYYGVVCSVKYNGSAIELELCSDVSMHKVETLYSALLYSKNFLFVPRIDYNGMKGIYFELRRKQ